MDFKEKINGHDLEFYEDGHTYLIDGVIVPSITTLLKRVKFADKYKGISKEVLQNAANNGIYMHEQIEKYCRGEEYDETPEVHNFKFLEKSYKFKPIANEVSVMLFKDDKPVAAGRVDMVIEMNGQPGGADLKRTYNLDKEYLAYQLNLYRTAYKQTYGIEWKFLKAIHLREQTRKFVNIPINEELVDEILGGVE